MDPRNENKLRTRVVAAATAALARQGYVSAIDVLLGLGWVTAPQVTAWRTGQVNSLERVAQTNLPKVTLALTALRQWAIAEGLRPSETDYVARTRDRRRLRFSVSGAGPIEAAYRTHWVSPELGEKKQERLRQKVEKPELVVVSALNPDWTCVECGGSGELLVMEGPGPHCLACVDLDHLVFLPAGDAAVTRRAVKASPLHAVVVRFSRARKRYERQGVLVQEEALAKAEAECLVDGEARARRRLRDAVRREGLDEAWVGELAKAIRALWPGCPDAEAEEIARHAALRGSGRVGRTEAAKALDPQAITLAVVASVRHRHTGYDELLAQGTPRAQAREEIAADVERVLSGWRSPAR